MKKTYRPEINMWALDTDADHILHQIGSDNYTEIRHATVKDPESYEEIAVADGSFVLHRGVEVASAGCCCSRIPRKAPRTEKGDARLRA